MKNRDALRSQRILIIDDCSSTLQILGRTLSSFGSIYLATDGKQGIKIAEDVLPSLIVLDIGLPDISGISLCKTLKSHNALASVPILFITASDDSNIETEAFEAGCVDFIRKPINNDIVTARVRIQLELIEHKERLIASTQIYKNIVTKLPNFVSYWDNDLKLIYSNDENEDWFTLPEQTIGLHLSDLLKGSLFREVQPKLITMKLKGTVSFETEIEVTDSESKFVSISLVSDKVFEKQSGFILLITDLTRLKSELQAPHRDHSTLVKVVDFIGESVICVDLHGAVTFMNPIAEKMTGVPKRDAYGKPVEQVMKLIDSVTAEPLINPVQFVLSEKRVIESAPETSLVGPQSRKIDIEESSAPIRNAKGELTGAIITFHDVTNLKRAERELNFVTNHDVLTKLPNRVLLFDRVEQAMHMCTRHDLQIAIIVLNIDYFRKVNDIHGYAIGDLLLKKVALFLNEFVRETDTLSRHGGDEFVFFLNNVADANHVQAFCTRVLQAFTKKWRVTSDLSLQVTATMGVALSSVDAQDAHTLYRRANAAMHKAKSETRNNVRFYSAKIEKELAQHLFSVKELETAISNQDIRVYYQPKFDCKSRRISGVEALVRWHKGEDHIIMPSEFIPLAEETGLIISLGEKVLRTACREVKKWHANNPTLSLSINVSALQFNTSFVETVEEVLSESGFPAELLEIEITETVLVDNEIALDIFSKFKALGLKLSLDDFGTGFSSLSYIKSYPLDVLKIDRSFVLNMLNDSKSKAIVDTIIMLSHSLNLECVAEGVETEEHVKVLEELGCSLLQGFYFSRPVDSSAIESLLEKLSSSKEHRHN